MHMEFTEREVAAIDRVPFAWTVRGDADPEVAESVRRKLRLLNDQKAGPRHGKGGRRA